MVDFLSRASVQKSYQLHHIMKRGDPWSSLRALPEIAFEFTTEL